MSVSLVRGRSVVTHAIDRNNWNEIADGAVLQENGIITAVGAFTDLSSKHPQAPVIGTGNEILLPGFINGHHHVGLTPFQLGSPDMPLELWFVTRMVSRNLNLYLDTLYSAFEMIASGITTVQHIHGWVPGNLAQVEHGSNEVIRAYRDIGMRVSYSFAVRNQNRLVYQADDDFVASLPAELRPAMQRWYNRMELTLDDYIALFENLYGQHQTSNRAKIQLAPANLHWCSDEALTRLAETSRKYNVPLHMHLLETAYQKEYAARRGDCSAVEYIDRFGLLGPHMTLGHGVWLNEKDIDRLAATGTCVCHNCSSNFRLRSGVAALNHLEACGVNTAIGIDEAGINDDRDMLQEMRMVLRAHREPGMDDRVPTMAQVFRMASENGAKTTPYAARIGTLEVGKAADAVLIDWQQISYPYLDSETPVLDAVIQRAKVAGVRAVLVAGEVIYQDGRFTRVDRDAAMRQLSEILQRDLTAEEQERRHLAKAILPHVKAFYDGYWNAASHQPFYSQSSRT
jgi:5-methylthioadenosine/S-adenosylhomocysteine deaminase